MMEIRGGIMIDYFVLCRNDEYQIVSCEEGQNPLYGHGSWDLFSGPFDSWDAAEEDAWLVKEAGEE